MKRGVPSSSEAASSSPSPSPSPSPAPSPPLPSLEAAEAALAAGDRALALDALLEAWRACRAPALAEVIERVSSDCARALPAIPDGKDHVRTWFEIDSAARAVDVPRLLPGLLHDPMGTVGERVGRLVARGPDPRVGRALLAFVDSVPTTATSNAGVWVQVFNALPSMIDDGALAEVRRLRARRPGGSSKFWPRLDAWLARLEAALGPPATLDAATAKRVAAMSLSAARLALEAPQPVAAATVTPVCAASSVRSARPPSLELDAARAAIATGDHEAALGCLLALWAPTRDPDVASIIDEVTALAVQRRSPSQGPVSSADWIALEAEGHAVDVQALVEGIGVAASESVQRMAHLLARPEDPRIGRAIFATLTESRTTGDDYWCAVLDLLARHGGPAHLETVTDLARRTVDAHAARHFPHWRARNRHADRVRDAFAARMARLTPLPAALQQALPELRAALPRPDAHPEAAMMAQIVAAPDDDAPRLVFADWLTERGDPWGELISLQCSIARTPDRKLSARMKELRKTNQRRWTLLGPLLPITCNDEQYTRGMLTHVCLRDTAKSQLKLLAHPRLATVESVDVRWVQEETAIVALLSPTLVSLRRVEWTSFPVLEALATSARPLPVRELSVSMSGPEAVAAERRQAIVEGAGLPSLRWLHVHAQAGDPSWLLAGALGARLERLVLGDEQSGAMPALAACLAAVQHRSLSLAIEAAAAGGRCTVTPDGACTATIRSASAFWQPWLAMLVEARPHLKGLILDGEGWTDEHRRALL